MERKQVNIARLQRLVAKPFFSEDFLDSGFRRNDGGLGCRRLPGLHWLRRDYLGVTQLAGRSDKRLCHSYHQPLCHSDRREESKMPALDFIQGF